MKAGVTFEIFTFGLCSKEAHALMTSSFRSHKDLQDHGTKPPCFVARCDLLNSKTFYSLPWYVYYANRFEICPKYMYFVIAAFLLYHVVSWVIVIHRLRDWNIERRIKMEGFCRYSFWNQTLVWNTTNPRLTDCFQDTVMIGIPCVFLWLLTPFWLLNIYRRRRSQFPLPNRKFITLAFKILSLIILMGNVIFKLILRVEILERLYPSDMVGLSLLLVSYTFIGFLTVIERKLFIHTSPLQFYFWWVWLYLFVVL